MLITTRKIRSLAEKFSLFLIVGALSTGIQYVLLWGLVNYASMTPVWASTLGFISSAVVNYALNRRYTFQSHTPHKIAFRRFVLVALTGLVLNGLVMSIGINWLNMKYFLAQILATVTVLFSNFFANLKWSFASTEKTTFAENESTKSQG